MGRPSEYNSEISDLIVAGLEGASLNKICAEEGMPDRNTVTRWMRQHVDFAAKCARAREEHAEYRAEQVLDIADDVTEATHQSARVKIAAYQWYAAKIKPKKYGNFERREVSGPEGKPIAVAVGDLATTKDPNAASALYGELVGGDEPPEG